MVGRVRSKLRRGVGEALAHVLVARRPRLHDLMLCYHRVVPKAGTCYDPAQEVTLDALELQLEEAARHWELSDAASWLAGLGQTHPRPRLALSFDDARREILPARPLLEARGIRPVVFVPTCVLRGEPLWFDQVAELVRAYGTEPEFRALAPDLPVARGARAVVLRIARSRPGRIRRILDAWEPWARRRPLFDPWPYLSADDLRELDAAGWILASHTEHHHWLPALDAAEIERELRQSRATLGATLGHVPQGLGYPAGGQNSLVRRVAREAGYEWAMTVEHGGGLENRYRLDRRNVSTATSAGLRHPFCPQRFVAELNGDMQKLRKVLGWL